MKVSKSEDTSDEANSTLRSSPQKRTRQPKAAIKGSSIEEFYESDFNPAVPAFDLTLPQCEEVPILVSIPHAGIYLSERTKAALESDIACTLPDTDWYVDQIYQFVSSMGITLIKANYHRYVIDLNRHLNDQKIYDKSRRETTVFPKTTFRGLKIHKKAHPNEEERAIRIDKIYNPYHQTLFEQLNRLKSKFGKVLLFDAHSITRMVPLIHKVPLPDLMLGDQDGTTSHRDLVKTAADVFKKTNFTFNYNEYFKGGAITQTYAKPAEGVYTMQLEMAHDLYLDSTTIKPILDQSKTAALQDILKELFVGLVATLTRLP